MKVKLNANNWVPDNAQRMVYMNEDLTADETKFFKLVADMEMVRYSETGRMD